MHSRVLRRLVIVMVAVLLAAMVIMLVGYMLFSRNIYAEIKLHELEPIVHALGDLTLEYMGANVTRDTYVNLADSLISTDGCTLLITNRFGDLLLYRDNMLMFSPEEASGMLSPVVDAVLRGMNVSDSGRLIYKGTKMIVVGCPIIEKNGQIYGAVIMLKPPRLITGTTAKMSATILWITAFVLPIALLSTVWRVKSVTKPINEMSAAAMEMSKGNFDIRINEDELGEIGELARALNTLCFELSNTITALENEKSQLDEILQSLSDGVVALDSEFKLIHYNTALMRMFGSVSVSKKEDLISDRKIWQEFELVMETGEANTISYNMPGNKVIWITISPVLNKHSEKLGVVALFKDMSELERVEKMRREYVANVSHELRTPLTALRGLLEPLSDGLVKTEEDRQRYYKIMLHEVMRLSRLITDMMTLSKLQSGTEYMSPEKVDIYEIVNGIAGGYASTVANKGVELIVDCPSPVPECMTDGDRIEQVIVILLDNAVRYTPEGGTITLGLRNKMDHVELTVKDTGCGIPEKDLPHIFERFYKVDKSRGEGGTGLGLSIAKFIMDRLGEELSVESIVDVGTCFTLTIKHYVKNAIALGPAGEKEERYGDEVSTAGMPQREIIAEDVIVDAKFEVLKHGKHKNE